MKARTRSLSGALTAILIIPFVIGLLACIPVPIGDPEKSRVDDEITGIWYVREGEDAYVNLFEPYDKRTWLVTKIELEIEFDEWCDEPGNEPEGYDEIMAALRDLGEDCLGKGDQASYKAWTKTLGDTTFMTWEMKGGLDEDHGFHPLLWLGYKIEKAGPDEFTLRMINGGHDVFSEFEENKGYKKMDDEGPPFDPRAFRSARRAFERLLKKNADNEEIYSDGDVDPMLHYRIVPDDYDLFIGNVVPDPTD